MATSTSFTTPPAPAASPTSPPPGTELTLWLAETALQAQQLQLAALLSGFGALAAIQNELWDQWVCRWGGGVPIDV